MSGCQGARWPPIHRRDLIWGGGLGGLNNLSFEINTPSSRIFVFTCSKCFWNTLVIVWDFRGFFECGMGFSRVYGKSITCLFFKNRSAFNLFYLRNDVRQLRMIIWHTSLPPNYQPEIGPPSPSGNRILHFFFLFVCFTRPNPLRIFVSTILRPSKVQNLLLRW